MLCEEAGLYAHWFGKLVADRIDWQRAAESVDPAVLWGAVAREWSGEEWAGAHGVTTLETLALEDELPDELILADIEAPADVGFRTIVGDHLGLYTEPGPMEVLGGARVKGQARRA